MLITDPTKIKEKIHFKNNPEKLFIPRRKIKSPEKRILGSDLFSGAFFWNIPSIGNQNKILDFFHPYWPISREKISLWEGTFCTFCTRKCEIRCTKAENKEKISSHFCLRVLLTSKKGINELGFEKKVEIIAPLYTEFVDVYLLASFSAWMVDVCWLIGGGVSCVGL